MTSPMKTPLVILVFFAMVILHGIADDSADTYNGQPVDSNLSTDDANAYVDLVVKKWFDSVPSGSIPKIGPQDLIKLATAIRRVGVPDLISAYSHTAPDAAYRMNVELDPQNEIKRAVVEKALSLTATASDIDSLIGLYDTRPLILNVLVDHSEWDSDQRVIDFLVSNLDQINEAYKKSDLAPTRLLQLAARNSAPAVQSKLDAVLTDATQNDGNYPNAHLYLNLISIDTLTPSPTIAKHLPDIFAVLPSRAKSPPSDIYNEISPENVFTQLQLGNMATNKPVLFADQKTRDAILKLASAAEDGGFQGARVLVPAAVCGDKKALVKLVDLYHDSETTEMERNLARKFLETIAYHGAGDKLANVVTQIGTATYDPATCTWTIPDGTSNPPT
jgi:hypothetical protein